MSMVGYKSGPSGDTDGMCRRLSGRAERIAVGSEDPDERHERLRGGARGKPVHGAYAGGDAKKQHPEVENHADDPRAVDEPSQPRLEPCVSLGPEEDVPDVRIVTIPPNTAIGENPSPKRGVWARAPRRARGPPHASSGTRALSPRDATCIRPRLATVGESPWVVG